MGTGPSTINDEKFTRAFLYTIKNESADFVNHPLDSGGPTRYGITQCTLSSHLGGQATVDDVRRLTEEEAKEIYKALYWDKLRCDAIPSSITTKLFDAAVLFGVYRSAVCAQATLERHGYVIKVDGLIGPRTLSALQSCNSMSFCALFSEELEKRITSIILASPKNKVFEKGWRARVARYRGVK